MDNLNLKSSNRRRFLKNSALLASGITLISYADLEAHQYSNEDNTFIVGPREGYTPRIGTLLSTMTMMRSMVVHQVRNLTMEQLDYLVDDQANSIGAMLLHLAATEKYYQLNTFQGVPWGEWDKESKAKWDIPMGLGQAARDTIKGNGIEYYLAKLDEVRVATKAEFAKRDDAWLDQTESFFGGKPTNIHAKWFHVCEHESNHNGQIKFIKKRMPA